MVGSLTPGPLGGDFRSAGSQDEEEAKIIDLDLTAVLAFPGKEFRVTGRYVVIFPQQFSTTDANKVTTATGVGGACFASVGASGKVPIYLQPGTIYKFDPFDKLFLINSVSQPGKAIRLYITTNPIITIAAPPQQISGTVAIDGFDGIEGASRAYFPGPAPLFNQFFSAAANVNGAILRTGVVDVSATHRGALITGTVAPADVNDTVGNHCLQSLGGAAVNLPFPLKIAAGRGLWGCQDAVSVASFAASWDLL